MNGASKAGDVGSIRRNSTSYIPAHVANVVIDQLQQGFKEMAVKDDGSGTRTKQDSEQQNQSGLSGHGTGSREDKKEEFRIFSATIAPKIDAVTPQGVADLDLSHMNSPIEDTQNSSGDGQTLPDTPVKGTKLGANAPSSPIRQETLATSDLKETIKGQLQAAFRASTHSGASAVRMVGVWGSPSRGIASQTPPSPTKIAQNMAAIYSNQQSENLDVFLEAFGEVLAEKGPQKPDVFHEFFSLTHGAISSFVGYRDTMIGRFTKGFSHHIDSLGAVDKQSAKTKILHANPSGGKSCIQHMGETLNALCLGGITQSKANLIYDLAGILMSETNRGDLSDSKSGVSIVYEVLRKYPDITDLLRTTEVGGAITAVLETEYSAKNSTLGNTVPIGKLSGLAAQFYANLDLAKVLDILSPRPNSFNLEHCVIHQVEGTAGKLTGTREADLYLKIEFPNMSRDFSGVQTRHELDTAEATFKNQQFDIFEEVLSLNPKDADNEIRDNFDTLFSLFTKSANKDHHEIVTNKAARLIKLQAEFASKLLKAPLTPIFPPTLRELNTAFVDLYRSGEPEYAAKSVALTTIAGNVMGGYRQSVSGLQTAVNPPINGSHDAKLTEIDRRLSAHSHHQAEFNRLFAADAGPMAIVRAEQNGEIQRPIDELLTRKLEVANDKLTVATADVKTVLQELYTVLGIANPDADAVAAADSRKTTVSTTITRNEGPSRQADTTSAAADLLKAQITDIRQLKTHYKTAQDAMRVSVDQATTGLNRTTVTADVLEARYDDLFQTVAGAGSRFNTSAAGNTDPLKTTVNISGLVHETQGVIARALHAFAESGISARKPGETAAQRLTYLQTEATRLGRFLPETTKTEKDTLTASENLRIANEATAAARAAASAAALAKAVLLADISTSKRDLDTRRASLDTLRDRRLDTDATREKATTNRTGTEFANLHPLDATSTESGIATYQSKMATYKTAITAEIAALKACEAADISRLDTVKGTHANTVSAYQREVDATRTESAEVTRLSALLATEGATPKASTMADFSAALTADTTALGTARNDKTRELATANTQFETAKRGMTTALGEFYRATGVTENAATKSDAKAQTARTNANIDDDPHIAVKTTRTNVAKASLTAEVQQIQTLTRLYTTALNALDAADRTTQTPTALNDKTATLLSDFDRNTARMPAAEKAIARDRLVGEIATKTTYKTQLDALTRANTEVTAELSRLSSGPIDAFHAALVQGLARLNALQRNLIQDGHTAKTTAQTLRDTITATLAMSTPLMANRPAAEKLPALRSWHDACGTLSGTLTTSTVPQAWRSPLTAEITTQSSRLNAREDRLTAVKAELNTARDTLRTILVAGGMSEAAATTQATTTLTTACLFNPTTEDELDGANRAVGLMASAIDMSRENNAMATATRRLETVTAKIRNAYAPGKSQRDLDTIMANVLQQADRETAQTLRGTDPTPSLKTNQKAEILETKLQELTDAAAAKAVKAANKKAIDAAFQQIKTLRGELKGTLFLQNPTTAEATEKRHYEEAVRVATAACDGASVQKPSLAFLQHITASLTANIATTRTAILTEATTALSTERDAWQVASGIGVATTATIEASLLNRRTKEELSVIELGTFLNDMKSQTAAYADITSAAKAYNTEQDLAPGDAIIQSEAAMAIYGKAKPSKKEQAQTVSAEKLHTAADTLRSRLSEIKESKQIAAAEQARTTAIQALQQKRAALEKQLTQVPDTMKARVALLQSVFSKLPAIETETNRLFPDASNPGHKTDRDALTALRKKVAAKYTTFLTVDQTRIMAESRSELSKIRTASSSSLETLSEGILSTHTQKARDLSDYKIKGANTSEITAHETTLKRFETELDTATAARRTQLETIRTAYTTATTSLQTAFNAAMTGIDFNSVTAAILTQRKTEFDTTSATAKRSMETTLQNIPPDTDQDVATKFDTAKAKASTNLEKNVKTRVSASFTKTQNTLSGLGASAPITELNTHTASAVTLQSRVDDLQAFLTPEQVIELNGIANTHFTRVITAAKAIAEAALATASNSAKQMTFDQISRETTTDLDLRMTTLETNSNEAITAFTTHTNGIPATTETLIAAKAALTNGKNALENTTRAAIQTTLSQRLQPSQDRIQQLLNNPATTLFQFTNETALVTQLKTRRAEIGATWLTDGLAAQIDATVAAYEAKVAALQTRAGQITALTEALAGLTFAIPPHASLTDKWTTIRDHNNAKEILLAHEDYASILGETLLPHEIQTALAALETRRTAAIADRAPERQALIDGLAEQLGGLETATFNWDATLATAETTAKDTLPAEMRVNADIQSALTTAKDAVQGLRAAVFTRVAPSESLATARAWLTGWPASTRSLANIQAKVSTARTTFGDKAATAEFAAWDTATDQAITELETSLADKISARDTLIASFQAIIDAPVRADTLANRWADIAAKETTLATLQATAANVPMLVDPQVAAKIAAVQASLDGYNTPTDLERSAVYEGINANLINAAHTRWKGAVGSVQDTLLNTQTSPRFHSAIRKVISPMRQDPIKSAIQARIDYKKTIATAAAVLAEVQARTATTLELQEAIEKIKVASDKDAPDIVDSGDGTNIFATADAAMATQKADIDAGLATHTALVAAFTAAIADATLQLPDMTTTPPITAQAKWVALNAANTAYTDAVAASDYLLADDLFGVAVHPEIALTNTTFNTAWKDGMATVTPEAAAIRQEAATRLTAFVTHGSTDPEPTFATLRDEALNELEIPIGFKPYVETALDGLGIQAEIQGRVDLHTALQDIETNPTRLSSNPRDTLEALTQMFGALAANPAYAACDSILAKRLQQLKVAGYGAAAEITAQQRLAGSADTFRELETAKKGSTSQILKLGTLSNQIELAFINPTHSPKWKYNVGLDTVLDDILSTNAPPADTTAFIDGLEVALTRLNLQAGGSGIPDPYKRMAESAIERLKTRNDGTPKLCAWVLSANISLVLSILESFGDTRIATVENPITGTASSLALHEGITLKKEDVTSLTGRTREHGELWYAMYGIPSEATPIAVKDIDAYNIPGQGIDEASFCTLIHTMSLTAGDFVSIADGYTAGASPIDATLTQTAWLSFCTAMGANGDIASFLESLWPSEPDATVSVRALHNKWKELLENETNYKHLRYLFGRKFERVYQELVIENPPI